MILRSHATVLLSTLCFVLVALGAPPNDGSDLSFYISRPDIRSPKLTVKTFDQDAVRPGYIFTAPYHYLLQAPMMNAFIPAQVGPHIYDASGDLVWSGADLTQNHVVTDFKPVTINGSSHLTFILHDNQRGRTKRRAAALILNSDYDTVQTLDFSQDFDPHEFTVIDNATSFLKISKKISTTEKILTGEKVLFEDTCATEIDSRGKETFSFCPWEKLGIDETMIDKPQVPPPDNRPWDPFHMNSMDKFSNGDYLLSIRFTNSIYRVSQTTGDVVWRLGGKLSDFEQNFNFSGQHDARIVSYNDTVTIISFFDNAAVNLGRYAPTSQASSLKVVALYTNGSPRQAVLLKCFNRPDGKHTRLRGNGHYYSSDGSAFVGWSIQGYASEFAPDGRVVQEVKFDSDRYNSYRIYKSDFVGTPSRPPDLVTVAASTDEGKMSLVFYVSWNGATEIATWEFFGADEEDGEYEILGQIPKTSFETTFVALHAWRYTWARAKDGKGNVLGETVTVQTRFTASFPAGIHDIQRVPGLEPISEPTRFPSIILMLELSTTATILIIVAIARIMGVSITTMARFLQRRFGVSSFCRQTSRLIGGK